MLVVKVSFETISFTLQVAFVKCNSMHRGTTGPVNFIF